MLIAIAMSAIAIAGDWTTSGITGTANTVPIFDGSGNPTNANPVTFVTGIVDAAVPSAVTAAIDEDVPPLISAGIDEVVPDMIEDAINELTPPLIVDAVDSLVPDLIDGAITLQVPVLVSDGISAEVPDMISTAIGSLVPDICDDEIEALVPDMIDAAIAAQVPDICDDEIEALVPDICDDEINELVPEIFELLDPARTPLDLGSSFWVSWLQATASTPGSGATGGSVIFFELFVEETDARVYEEIGTVVNTASTNSLSLALYELGSNGKVGDLLWNSASISAAAPTGMKLADISAGTWSSAGAAYKTGGNDLVLSRGDEVLLAEAHNGQITFRTYPVASLRSLGASLTGGAPATHWELTTTFGTWPSSGSLATVETGQVEALALNPL